MSKFIKFEVKRFPATRLIGKMVRMSLGPEKGQEAVDLWSSMWQDGCMDYLENMTERLTKERYTVGWMGDYDLLGNTCVYIAGVLTKEGTTVPMGYISRDLPECLMSIGWIQGREEDGDLYKGAHDYVRQAMNEYGYEYDTAAGGYEMQYYSFQRFGVPRYVGEKILIMDYYSPCKKLLKDAAVKQNNERENSGRENAGRKNAGIVDEMAKDMGKVAKSFDNLAQRLLYAYQCTYPICIPMTDDRASEISQRQMHGFLQDVINSLYNNPSILNFQDEKDDYYEFWMLNISNPELDDKMRKIEKVLFDFYAYLYKLGECGEVKDSILYVSKNKMRFVKKRLLQLEQIGLLSTSNETSTMFYSEKYPELFPAWKMLYEQKLLSEQKLTSDQKTNLPKKEIARFIYCMYDTENYYAEHFYGNIVDDSTLIGDLEQFLKDKGYHRYFDESGIHWEKEYQEKQKGNASFSFNWKKRDQMTFSFRVPNFRVVASHFDEMIHELKELTFSRMKNCDGCGYCTQMDKTGKRKSLVMDLECDGTKSGKCPLFPNLTWRNIDKKEVEKIKGLFDFAEMIKK